MPAFAPRVATGLEPLNRAVMSLVGFVRSTPEVPAAAGRGTREVLAHLVHWHEHYVFLVRELTAGREPELPRGSFEAIEAELAELTVPKLAARLQSAQGRLEDIVARAGPPARVRITAGSRAWPWPELVERVSAHVHDHEAALRRARQGAQPSRAGGP